MFTPGPSIEGVAMNKFLPFVLGGFLIGNVLAEEEEEKEAEWLAELTDLASLTSKYKELKTEVSDATVARSQRIRTFEKQLTPVAQKIGKVDTPESYDFLKDEFETAKPLFAALCAEAMLYSTKKEVMPFALQEYTNRPPRYRIGLLKGLGETPNDLKPYARKLLGIAQSEKDPNVRRYLPRALGNLDMLAAAKMMLTSITPVKDRNSPSAHAQLKFNDEVAEALGGSENEKIHDWVKLKAFKIARSDAFRLEVVARAAGDLGLEEARQGLEKALKHPDPFTAGAAAEAIGKIGASPSSKKLIAALEKGRARRNLRFRAKALDALATSDDDKALAFLLKASGSKDSILKALVMQSLMSIESPKALKAVLAALKDANPNVRSTALTALSKTRSKTMIAPLIDYVGSEQHERLQIDGLKLLVSLTGVNMELNVADWKKWWKGAETSFKLPEEVDIVVGKTSVLRKTAEDVKITPKYFGMEITATNRATFIVDVSGSMAEKVVLESGDKVRKIDVLKRELTQVIGELPDDSHLNIIAFNHTFKPWQKQLVPLKGKGRRNALKYVSTLQAVQATNVYDTLEFALRDKNVDTIFLLSDGEPTAGRFTEIPAILREIKILNRARAVSINGIAFGEESKLLRKLSEQNKGEYRFVKTKPAT